MEKILIVDDNKYIRFALTSLLEDAGYKPIAVGDGYKAIKEAKTKKPSLVILDMKLPGMDGIQILEELKKIDPSLIVIMLTAFGDVKSAVQSIKVGAYDYLTKPFDNDEMVLMIKKALETKYLNQEVQQLWKKIDEQYLSRDIIGSSPAMQEVLNQVDIVAPTNMTVVIQGESGTGKEVIANMIHKKSLRKDKNLVAIDCGAIPETLIESELFGYEKGAFTGADAQKEGKFEQANEGTLFLDEITNLSDGNQTKLLRVIQEKKVNRLGGKKDHNVDVRIIAATNMRLTDAVKEGKFRSDLYYRLNEFHLNLPLLKDRKEDIPLFVKYFTQDANSELNKNVKNFSAKAMKAILNYSWPGNVRELRNVIRRAILMSQSELVDYVPLPEENLDLNDDVNAGEILKEKSSLENYTKQFERDLIMKALQEAGGNKTKAAKILNMNERTFYRKIKSLGL
ncbi:MAG: sigma-54-dependent Fis family transcriptional regulator [Ignavibacteriae bacterium]|nr:MAG: sigma-54-dependent Fis family transcriptional regulator [Ignavibacteriota bacterium]